MNKLLAMRLFNLINKKSQIENQAEFESAYEEFIEQIRSITESKNDYIDVIRLLNLTRIELMILETFSLYEQGKKCAKEIYYKGKITY